MNELTPISVGPFKYFSLMANTHLGATGKILLNGSEIHRFTSDKTTQISTNEPQDLIVNGMNEMLIQIDSVDTTAKDREPKVVIDLHALNTQDFPSNDNRVLRIEWDPSEYDNQIGEYKYTFPMLKAEESEALIIQRGLEHCLLPFSESEQRLIRFVALRLVQNGFSIDEVTKITLGERFKSDNDYYGVNEVSFFNNLIVNKGGDPMDSFASVTISFEDPNVIYREDGGIEFEVGRRVKLEDLVPTFYGLRDEYNSGTHVEEESYLFYSLDQALINGNIVLLDDSNRDDNPFSSGSRKIKSSDIPHVDNLRKLISKGLEELVFNHLIGLTPTKDRGIKVFISSIEFKQIDKTHVYQDFSMDYTFLVDLYEKKIILVDVYDRNFFPSPAVMPPIGEDWE